MPSGRIGTSKAKKGRIGTAKPYLDVLAPIHTIKKNRQKALMYCRFAYEKGCNPFAPHVYYTEFLDDENKRERQDGMRMGLEWMWAFKEVWVFGGIISEGIKKEIELAMLLKIKVRYFDEFMEEVDRHGKYIR